MSDSVQLTDLDVIIRYSIAVRSAAADRDELIETLRADLDWLEQGVGGSPRRRVELAEEPPLSDDLEPAPALEPEPVAEEPAPEPEPVTEEPAAAPRAPIRRMPVDVRPAPKRAAPAKKAAVKKVAVKKVPAKHTATKKPAASKTAVSKSAAKKAAPRRTSR
jgi:outer membrane biosynthesis protein TonB